MPRTKDPLARDRQVAKVKAHRPAHIPPMEVVDERKLSVWKLKTEKDLTPQQIAKELGISVDTVHRDLNDKHQEILAAMSEIGQIRRSKNERELEDFKAHCASYIYDPDVVIRGTKIVDGEVKVIELSKFDAMVKIMPFYLTAMNIQNKMWGLYTVPNAPSHGDAPGTMNIKNVSISMVQELQRIAKSEKLALPSAIRINDSRPTDNSTPNPDL